MSEGDATMIFIERQINLMQQELEGMNTNNLNGFYAARVQKAVIGHLKHIRAQGQVNISNEDLSKLTRYWRERLHD